MNKIEKYADFAEARKISVQFYYKQYKNGENAKILKMYDKFH